MQQHNSFNISSMSLSMKLAGDEMEKKQWQDTKKQGTQQQETQPQLQHQHQHHIEDHLKFPNEMFQMLLTSTTFDPTQNSQQQHYFDQQYINKPYNNNDGKDSHILLQKANETTIDRDECYLNGSDHNQHYLVDEKGKEKDEIRKQTLKVLPSSSLNQMGKTSGVVLDVNFLDNQIGCNYYDQHVQQQSPYYYLPQWRSELNETEIGLLNLRKRTTSWKQGLPFNLLEAGSLTLNSSLNDSNTGNDFSAIPRAKNCPLKRLRATNSFCATPSDRFDDLLLTSNCSDALDSTINSNNTVNLPITATNTLSSLPPTLLHQLPSTQCAQQQRQMASFQNGYFRHSLPLKTAIPNTIKATNCMPSTPPPPPPPSAAASSLLLASSSSSTLSLPLSSEIALTPDLHTCSKQQQLQSQSYITATKIPLFSSSSSTSTSTSTSSSTTITTTTFQRQSQNKDNNLKLFSFTGTEVDNEKLSTVGVIVSASGYSDGNNGSSGTGRLPHSSTGSLTSIITTSIASSEPDPGVSGGNLGTGNDNKIIKEKTKTSRFGRKHSNPSGDDDPRTPVVPNNTNVAGEPGNNDEKLALNRPGIKQEKWTSILLQVSIPFLLAGIGTIGAGIILGKVEKWQVFKSVAELFILVPALLGLKGNLDMCLASRMSTQVNLGNFTGRKEVIRTIIGNIALVQVQATVASFLVAMFAVTIGAIKHGHFIFDQFMLLVAAAMFTATTSCFVLDFVLVAVILISQKFQLNPDNLATPLAASIGDVVSISLLSFIASLLYEHINTHLWVTFLMVVCYLSLLPLWVIIVLKNKYARPIMSSGWVPVISALCISGFGGLVLDTAVEVFKGFVVFQPIINGIGGNLVSVHASKISTMLHQSSIIGIIPPHTKIFEWPWKALFKGVPYANTARLLICISIPGNIIFICVADYIHMSQSTISLTFIATYVVTSTIQVMLLLYIAHIIVHAMWKWKIDPDNSSIPYLTALGDLLGSSLLGIAFLFLLHINMEYGDGYYEAEGKDAAAATAAVTATLNVSN